MTQCSKARCARLVGSETCNLSPNQVRNAHDEMNQDFLKTKPWTSDQITELNWDLKRVPLPVDPTLTFLTEAALREDKQNRKREVRSLSDKVELLKRVLANYIVYRDQLQRNSDKSRDDMSAELVRLQKLCDDTRLELHGLKGSLSELRPDRITQTSVDFRQVASTAIPQRDEVEDGFKAKKPTVCTDIQDTPNTHTNKTAVLQENSTLSLPTSLVHTPINHNVESDHTNKEDTKVQRMSANGITGGNEAACVESSLANLGREEDHIIRRIIKLNHQLAKLLHKEDPPGELDINGQLAHMESSMGIILSKITNASKVMNDQWLHRKSDVSDLLPEDSEDDIIDEELCSSDGTILHGETEEMPYDEALRGIDDSNGFNDSNDPDACSLLSLLHLMGLMLKKIGALRVEKNDLGLELTLLRQRDEHSDATWRERDTMSDNLYDRACCEITNLRNRLESKVEEVNDADAVVVKLDQQLQAALKAATEAEAKAQELRNANESLVEREHKLLGAKSETSQVPEIDILNGIVDVKTKLAYALSKMDNPQGREEVQKHTACLKEFVTEVKQLEEKARAPENSHRQNAHTL